MYKEVEEGPVSINRNLFVYRPRRRTSIYKYKSVCLQAQKKDQSKFYGELLEKRRTAEEKEQEK